MMPTIPASTGGSAGWHGKLASLPRTKNTRSPTPAPTESTATMGRPTSSPSAPIGCTSSSLMLSRLGSLMVATTAPITRAICICLAPLDGWAQLLAEVDRIDDADDRGIDRRVL